MKRQRKPLKTILISFSVTVVLLAAVTGIYIYSMLSKINTQETIEQIAPENESFETEDNSNDGTDVPLFEPEAIDWTDGEPAAGDTPGFDKPTNEKKVINILLIGQDKRPGEKRARSDAMIIASYNTTDRKLKLISLMRDMYVPIPGYSDNRINAAYQFGGMALLDKTIEKNFGVGIDGNFEIDFEGFTQLVDILGGVDVRLSKAEAAHLNKKFGWRLTEGINQLNGQQTLEYTRIRYVGNGDFERTDRQRIILTRIFDGIMRLNLVKKHQIIDKMLPYLTTDMSKQEILGFAYTVLTTGVHRTETYRVPADGAFKTMKIRKMDVLVPNLKKTRALIRDHIYQ